MNRVVCFLLVAVAGCSYFGPEPVDEATQAWEVTDPHDTEPDTDCVDLSVSLLELRIDEPTTATLPFPDGVNSISVTTDGTTLEFESTLALDYAIVAGGADAVYYRYRPELTASSGLTAPADGAGGTYPIAHVSFCYDYELVVRKTAVASMSRRHTWTIDKEGSVTELSLAVGESGSADYTVSLTSSSSDIGYGVSGTITVENPTPYASHVEYVEDLLDRETPIPVTCDVTFPYLLPPGGTITCTYEYALPDGAAHTNKARAHTRGLVKPGMVEVDFDFSGVTVDEVDRCVDVTDSLYGDLGTVCAGDDGVFHYTMDIGPYEECGPQEHVNVASFTAHDTGATGSDDHTVTVDVACGGGCTLTQGYWKTHSEYGPAPYDDTWASLSDGADTTFFLSGKSYITVLKTSPRGNAYYILAHQYIAAQLNGLAGASTTPEVSAAFAEATTLLSTYGTSVPSTLRARFVALGGILASYNEGGIGPGHCDDLETLP